MVKVKTHCEYYGTVADLQKRNDLTLVCDSQDVEPIINHFPKEDHEWLKEYGCFFVEVTDGDYGDIFGCDTYSAYLSSSVDKLWLEYSEE